jgi:uncharacterized membrane protein YciS (DUF1049 family)
MNYKIITFDYIFKYKNFENSLILNYYFSLNLCCALTLKALKLEKQIQTHA